MLRYVIWKPDRQDYNTNTYLLDAFKTSEEWEISERISSVQAGGVVLVGNKRSVHELWDRWIPFPRGAVRAP